MKKIISLFISAIILLSGFTCVFAAEAEVREDMAMSYGGGAYIDNNPALAQICQRTGLGNFSYGYIVTYSGGFGGGGADASLPVENAAGYTKLTFDARIITDDMCSVSELFDFMYPSDAPHNLDSNYPATQTAQVFLNSSWEDEFVDINCTVDLTTSWQHYEFDLTPYNLNSYRVYINPLGAVSGQNETCSAIVANLKLEGGSGSSPAFGPTSTPSSWAQEYIDAAVSYGIIDGQARNYQANISRRDFAYIITDTIYSAFYFAGLESPEIEIANNFTDVPADDYLYDAYSMGIIKGISDTLFAPDNFITRQEIAVMMHRTLKYLENAKGQKYVADSTSLNSFTDAALVADWAKDAVSSLAASGIMKGTSDTTLSPLDNTTVEQAIILAVRIVDLTK